MVVKEKSSTPTIAQLQDEGLVVRVYHYRVHPRIGLTTREDCFILGISPGEFAPCGGATVVEIHDPETKASYYGRAYVNTKDNYNRRIGRMIGLSRAFKDFSE